MCQNLVKVAHTTMLHIATAMSLALSVASDISSNGRSRVAKYRTLSQRMDSIGRDGICHHGEISALSRRGALSGHSCTAPAPTALRGPPRFTARS
ncbi:hypothetical protein EVAR_19710_1 [Eumeta japonica]|uniref:Secreted protein n=1 Tax=Eumeta variegata TaxID=151549 RepID=A0A4C1UQR8_EUMVA|nr:hypothetical protein EVAR_19710_1 [Eumeta japonica]